MWTQDQVYIFEQPSTPKKCVPHPYIEILVITSHEALQKGVVLHRKTRDLFSYETLHNSVYAHTYPYQDMYGWFVLYAHEMATSVFMFVHACAATCVALQQRACVCLRISTHSRLFFGYLVCACVNIYHHSSKKYVSAYNCL